MELLFIRHALPQRVEGFEGPADPELSDAGHHQARHLGEYLAFERIHAVFASPLKRAVQTAEPVAARQSIDVTIADGIAEYDREASEYIPIEQLKAENHPGWRACSPATSIAVSESTPTSSRAGVVEAVEAIVGAPRVHADDRLHRFDHAAPEALTPTLRHRRRARIMPGDSRP